jgi:hypothetical protein
MFINRKIRSVETIPGIGIRWIKKNDGGGEFKYDIFDIFIIRTFVSATMYPYLAQQ